jgi:NAD(P)-dependent dehydrogenase (short-subunit alcohol dehydrogenase family)
MKVEGGTVVITGGGSGIGAALAAEAAARGATAIALLDIDGNAATEVAAEIGKAGTGTDARAYACDASDVEAVDRVAERVIAELGLPRLVCANAGVSPAVGNLLDGSAEDFSWVLSVNVVGVWATLRAFGRPMIASGEPGWLMATASEHALGVAHLGLGAYTASKHAVLGMCDVLRGELPEHVGISALCPGLVATNFWKTGRLRPQSAGGPIEPDALGRMVMEQGLDAGTLAVRALDGVEAEAFVIATHPHARKYAADRWRDVESAFDALDAAGVPQTSYDVNAVLERLGSAD